MVVQVLRDNLLLLPHLHNPCLAAPHSSFLGELNYSMWIWGCRNLTLCRDPHLEL